MKIYTPGGVDVGPAELGNLEAPASDVLGATVEQTWYHNPIQAIRRSLELGDANVEVVLERELQAAHLRDEPGEALVLPAIPQRVDGLLKLRIHLDGDSYQLVRYL